VLIGTTFDLDEYVDDAPQAGARGFILKDVRPEELAVRVRMISRGACEGAVETAPTNF
jgi:DNA-binding NarL/FixJ family response regulator